MIFTNNLNISSHELLCVEKPVGVALQCLAQYVKRDTIPYLKRLLWYIAIKVHMSLCQVYQLQYTLMTGPVKHLLYS